MPTFYTLVSAIVLSFVLHYLSTYVEFTPPGLTTQISVGQMPVGGATDYGPNTKQIHKVGSAQCQGHRQRQHRAEHKGHTPSPKVQIKISDSAGILTGAVGFEGRESTDHTAATD